jgi:hypothetical protein
MVSHKRSSHHKWQKQGSSSAPRLLECLQTDIVAASSVRLLLLLLLR